MYKKILVLVAFLLGAVYSEAQSTVKSPFSRFGIGELQKASSGWQMALGGISSGARSPYNINFGNPASHTASIRQGFLFEFGFQDKITQLNDESNTATLNTGGLSYLALRFPFTQWWGFSAGLLPYSTVGYNIYVSDSIPGAYNYYTNYKGNGGLNKVYIDNSFKIYDRLSLGVQASYIFGATYYKSDITVLDVSSSSVYVIDNRVKANNFAFSAGMQYHDTIYNDYHFVIGASFSNKTTLGAYSSTSKTRILAVNSNEYRDTIFRDNSIKQEMELPLYYSVGVNIAKGSVLNVGFDYYMQDWSNIQLLDNTGMKPTTETGFSLGVEYMPRLGSSKYLENIRYRAGFLHKQGYVNINNNDLVTNAITFGAGFPIKFSYSLINIGVELGKRGSVTNTLLEEKYALFVVNMSFQDIWFIKRRFD